MLWETGQGSMMCKVKWFYHPEEIETCGRKFDLKLPVRLEKMSFVFTFISEPKSVLHDFF